MEKTILLINRIFDDTEMLLEMNVEEMQDVISLATHVVHNPDYEIVIRQKAYVIICAAASTGIFSVKERWSLYWTLTSLFFTNDYFDVCEEALEGVYASIYEYVEKRLPDELKQPLTSKCNTIVIVTSQFLSLGHAPTRRVLDYADTIRKMGYEVVIINDAGLNIESYQYNYERRQFNCIDEYNGIKRYKYKNSEYKFYQNPSTMLDENSVVNMVYNIRQLHPCLVLNVGGSCVTSDLCHNFTKTATINCSTSIPRSLADYIVVCRDIRESDAARVERGLDRQILVESVYNYKFPKEQIKAFYSRADFSIPDESFLISTAGNRMDDELSIAFLEAVDATMSKYDDIYYLIVGNVGAYMDIIGQLKNAKRFILPGTLKDGSEAIKLSDLYIQPRRKGGGRAAFEALYYGIPAIIPNYGDAWDTCGSDFEVENYQKMIELIFRYHDDKLFYNEKSQKACARASILEDMSDMFEKLFFNIGMEQNEKYRLDVSDIFRNDNVMEYDLLNKKIEKIQRDIDILLQRTRQLE